jgi:hypothetical protein
MFGAVRVETRRASSLSPPPNKKNKNMMKKLLYTLLMGAFVFCMPSCMEIDNFDAPDAKISGRVIDAVTGNNVLVSHDDIKIRFQETSWTAVSSPSWQEIPIQRDGTYNNHRLFAGTYSLLPAQTGPWWPVDTVKNVVINKRGTTLDFEVTPLLHLIDFNVRLNATGDSLILSCRLQCHNPQKMVNGRMVNMPPVHDMRPYVSLLKDVGPGRSFHYDSQNDYRLQIRDRQWSAVDSNGDGISDITIPQGFIGQPNDSGSRHTWAENGTFFIRIPINKGYLYRVRMGASARGGSAPSNSINTGNKYNLSEIKEIYVPN